MSFTTDVKHEYCLTVHFMLKEWGLSDHRKPRPLLTSNNSEGLVMFAPVADALRWHRCFRFHICCRGTFFTETIFAEDNLIRRHNDSTYRLVRCHAYRPTHRILSSRATRDSRQHCIPTFINSLSARRQ